MLLVRHLLYLPLSLSDAAGTSSLIWYVHNVLSLMPLVRHLVCLPLSISDAAGTSSGVSATFSL
jgi:hypothetical protein